MPVSQQFLTAIERPLCSRCQARMMLDRVSPGPVGFERRLFECPRCDHVESAIRPSNRHAPRNKRSGQQLPRNEPKVDP